MGGKLDKSNNGQVLAAIRQLISNAAGSCVPTAADDTDAVNGRVSALYYDKTRQQPVVYAPSATASGLALLVSQPFGAAGYSTVSNFVYRESDGALQINIGAISAGVVADFAPVASVQAVQASLTAALGSQANTNSSLQTQIDGCVPTRPDDTDATEGRIDWLIYNKSLQQPVAFTPSLSVGLALLVSQTFSADGYSTISNLVYRQSDGALQVSVGSISAGVVADFAPVSSVTAVASDLSDETAARIAAIAAEQTDRANADATLQSQVDVRISTNASDDGTNSPLPFIAMNDAAAAPFAKLADGTSFRMVPSRPGSGYNSVDNISTGSDGTLIVADSSGAGPAYKPTETGTIPGGWYYKVGNLLVLNYTLSVVQAGSYTFPMPFSAPPVVQLTALAFDSQATTINLNGAPTATGFGILSSYWSGTQHDTGTNTIHVTATGLAA